MTQRFDDDELTYFDKTAKKFIELRKNWRDWCPFEPIPYVRDTEWKIVEKIREPMASVDGTMSSLAATAYTTGTAKVVHYVSHFQWPEVEVEVARNTGNQISTDEIRLALEKMDDRVQRFAIQGAMTWDGVPGTGLLANAVDVGVTTDLSAIYWSTIGTTGALGGPFQHAKAAFDVFNDAGYEPPYVWLLGSNCRTGLAQPTSDFDNRSARQHIAEAFGIEAFVFLPMVPFGGTQTQDDLTIKALPVPAANDSRWAMMKAEANHFAMQEIYPPKLTIVPDMDLRNKMYYGRLETAVAMRISQVAAVVDEDSVNFEA